MSDADACRGVYRALCQAMIAKDAAAMDALLGEGFALAHMTGLRQDKAAFIGAVLDGTLNYFSCRDDAIDVRVSGGRARLTGRSRVEAAVFGGGRHTWRLEQETTLAKEEGRWRVLLSKAGTY